MQTAVLRSAPVAALVLVSACGLLTDPPPPPGAPTSFMAEPAGIDAIRLTWESQGAPEEFRILLATGGSPFEAVAEVDGSARSFVVRGLVPDQRYEFRIQACGEGGCSAVREAGAATFAPMEIVTASLPRGFVGFPYLEGVDAVGGDGDFFWSVSAGALPAGLALGDTSGIVAGTPEVADVYAFTLTVRDGGGRTASRNFTIEIVAETPAVSIVTASLPPLMQDGAYRFVLQATGGDGSSYDWALAGGSLPPGLTLAPGGQIEGTATETGTFPFTLQVASGGATETQSFDIRVVPNRTDRFDITPYSVVDVPVEIQPHVDEALERWEATLTGDLPAVSIPAGFFGSSGCGGFGDAVNGTTTDDIIMMINIANIDGPGQVLGRAGPCGIRSTGSAAPRLPFVGVLTLDAADLEPLIGEETLTDLVFHEMAHVLGFGSLWETFDLVSDTATGDPRYTGEAGVDAWQALGGTGLVPVANTGGTGTEGVHWRESVFEREIMTGFSEPVGVEQPFSRLSVAAMADLGYMVDFSATDPYDLPEALADRRLADALGHDHVLQEPILVLEEDGGRRVLNR